MSAAKGLTRDMLGAKGRCLCLGLRVVISFVVVLIVVVVFVVVGGHFYLIAPRIPRGQACL